MEMEVLPPRTRIMVSLVRGPKRFKEIVEATNLSPATVDKWLKVLKEMSYIVKKEGKYRLTDIGFDVLKVLLTRVTKMALKLGLVAEVELAVTGDVRIEYDDYSGEYVMEMEHAGEVDGTRVKVYLGDSKEEVAATLKGLIAELENQAPT